jgi:hypothetical protein
MRDVVEVVVWLGDTILQVTHVPADAGYRIGSAPGVELAVAIGGLTRFPLIGPGLVLRLPAGIGGTVFTESGAIPLLAPELRLTAGTTVEVGLGLVTLRIARVALAPAPLPRPPVEVRPYGYGAVALFAHLIMWAVAMTYAASERLPAPNAALARPVHVHLFDDPEVPKPPPPPTLPSPAATTTAPAAEPLTSQARHDHAIEDARHAGVLGAAGLSNLRGSIISTVDLKAAFEGIGPVYNEHDANVGNFGNSHGFDPTGRPDWGTVPPGEYGTVSSGYDAGDEYFPGQDSKRPPGPKIALCKSAECTVTGAVERGVIDEQLTKRFAAFTACYRRYATPPIAGEVVLAFEITEAGKVRHTHGAGLGHVAGCVAEASAAMKFPATESATQVSYALSFTPA